MEIDRTRKVGIRISIKNYISLSSDEREGMTVAGWNPLNKFKSIVNADGNFSASICICICYLAQQVKLGVSNH